MASADHHGESPPLNVDFIIPALEESIPALLREAGIPGVSIALISNGSVVWSRGFGLKEL